MATYLSFHHAWHTCEQCMLSWYSGITACPCVMLNTQYTLVRTHAMTHKHTHTYTHTHTNTNTLSHTRRPWAASSPLHSAAHRSCLSHISHPHLHTHMHTHTHIHTHTSHAGHGLPRPRYTARLMGAACFTCASASAAAPPPLPHNPSTYSNVSSHHHHHHHHHQPPPRLPPPRNSTNSLGGTSSSLSVSLSSLSHRSCACAP